MSETYEDALAHVDHELIMEKHTDGDITLWCTDCNDEIERWSPPPVTVWHGPEWAKETGGEPDIHD